MTKLFQSKDVSCVCKSSFIKGRDVLDCPSCHSSNAQLVLYYCAFHKHANSEVQKPPSQSHFSLPSIIITIISNEPWNTETHKRDRNPPITHHKPWPFEPVKVKFCFLRGSLRWLTAVKNAIVSWLLNFRICMFVKSAVNSPGLMERPGWAEKGLGPFLKSPENLQAKKSVVVDIQ